jgi:hypothetical protein
MKTITIPATSSRNQRDILIARTIRYIARMQRCIQRIKRAEQTATPNPDEPAC